MDQNYEGCPKRIGYFDRERKKKVTTNFFILCFKNSPDD